MKLFRLLKMLFSEMNVYLLNLIRILPGSSGNAIRYHIYKNKFKRCGVNISISQDCYIRGCENIALGSNIGIGLNNQIYAGGSGKERIAVGDNVYLNSNVMINADIGGEIIIGNDVLIGPNVVFRASNHRFSDPSVPIKKQGHESGSIVVEDDVWFGANVVVLPNVTIGKGSVIAAGAVVNKDVEKYTIVGGVPAKKIGVRGKHD